MEEDEYVGCKDTHTIKKMEPQPVYECIDCGWLFETF